jgi:hypothetical protein
MLRTVSKRENTTQSNLLKQKTNDEKYSVKTNTSMVSVKKQPLEELLREHARLKERIAIIENEIEKISQ